jgi:hypothetical protein
MTIQLLLAALLAVAAPLRLHASVLTTPLGLTSGDQYRIVFVTSTRTDGLSADIADYNSFVNNAAQAGSQLGSLGATWRAIASTDSVDAIVNIGGSSNVPIYLLDGTLVATGTADLFDGSIAAPIWLDENGNIQAMNVWTGSLSDGTVNPGFGLGCTLATCSQGGTGIDTTPEVGVSLRADSVWLDAGPGVGSQNGSLYGISDPITVPGAAPEPSSFLLLAGAMALLAWRRRRRASAVG